MTASTSKGNGRPVTVAAMAEAKCLPAAFLRELGLADLPNSGVGIPYRDPAGNEIAVKRRTAIKAKDGSYWPKGQQLAAYGQWRLDYAQKAGFLILAEGESDCWALWHHGLPALGIPGANATKTLQREHLDAIAKVYVHRESDAGGSNFVEGVKRRLAELGFEGRAFELRLADGVKDPADLHLAEPGAFQSKLQAAIESSRELSFRKGDSYEDPHDRLRSRDGKAPTPALPAEPYQPFPVSALPEPARAFVDAASRAIGCDASYVALPLLTALAAAIGNSRTIRLKRGWTEPAVIWSTIVGESGTLKSPALEAPLKPLRARQDKAMREHLTARLQYDHDKAIYDMQLKQWQRKKPQDTEPPTPPTPPVCERFWVSDVTTEALAARLANAPRGLLLCRDELAGWIGSFGQYKGGKGADSAHFLTMHGARGLLVDRKTGDMTTIYVPRAALSICGGIQPAILKEALAREHFESGLAARLLLAMPPTKAKRWSECEVDPDLEARLADLFDSLYRLEIPINPVTQEPSPVAMPLSRDGKSAWVRFYNEHADEQAVLTGDLAAAWSKLEGYTARLALVVHLVRVAAGDPTADPGAVDAESIVAGATLSRWFGHECRRAYAALAEDEERRETRRLVEFIRDRGGRITARDLQRSNGKKFRDAAAAEAALNMLVEAALGRWTEPEGAARVRAFELRPTVRQSDTRADPNAADSPPASDTPSDNNTRTPETPGKNGQVSDLSDCRTVTPGSGDGPKGATESLDKNRGLSDGGADPGPYRDRY